MKAEVTLGNVQDPRVTSLSGVVGQRAVHHGLRSATVISTKITTLSCAALLFRFRIRLVLNIAS